MRISPENVRGRFYRPGQPFAAGELSAMALAGDLYPMLSGLWTSVVPPWTAQQRADGIWALLNECQAQAACGAAAAWIYTAGPGPDVIEYTSAHPLRRGRQSRLQPVRCVERDLRPEDLRLVAGATITSPERTAFDLLFYGEDDAHIVRDVGALHRSGCEPVDLSRLRQRIHRARRRPGKVRALDLLDQLDQSHGTSER
ncbi:hypothetical protein [Zhihengliuella flava]|uniref:AbiEi antitoxin C-terminal domain-containing protein n=1 Tax=Zhihengliuella flava TaxID=1285193 RepID=A0A931D9T2_9MICC|nr:hypothetical protein [Zhihengliuella flava]MBG6083456.1 hypothetical protein [Zhihengliuella flava]